MNNDLQLQWPHMPDWLKQADLGKRAELKQHLYTE